MEVNGQFHAAVPLERRFIAVHKNLHWQLWIWIQV